jgi:ATP-dependent Clp protease, protease subunit
MNGGAKNLKILISSSGGAVEEGFSLYNFLRALPVNLTIHCVGSVDSIAMVVFLASDQRFCCPNSTFTFHDFTWTFGANEALSRLLIRERLEILDNGVVRSKELLKEHAFFTDADFKALQLFEKQAIYNAGFAKERGIVQEIKEASVLTGPVFNVDF